MLSVSRRFPSYLGGAMTMRMVGTMNHNSRSTGSKATASATADPTARKPSTKCDPYGQQGKPLSYDEALLQLSMLDPGWKLVPPDEHTNSKMNIDHEDDGQMTCTFSNHAPPKGLTKRFLHTNYLDASKFVAILAAVAHNNHHYPTITIQRNLLKKEKAWEINTMIYCHTQVLGGLSYHDFHIAMMVDVEVQREYVSSLVIGKSHY